MYFAKQSLSKKHIILIIFGSINSLFFEFILLLKEHRNGKLEMIVKMDFEDLSPAGFGTCHGCKHLQWKS